MEKLKGRLNLKYMKYFFSFNRDEGKESKMKLAESHLKLGEVGLETGNSFIF